jgi:hypothetical protein
MAARSCPVIIVSGVLPHGSRDQSVSNGLLAHTLVAAADSFRFLSRSLVRGLPDLFYANVRMQINDNDPEDAKKVNQYQDEHKIAYLNGYKPKAFKVTNWDMKSFETVQRLAGF